MQKPGWDTAPMNLTNEFSALIAGLQEAKFDFAVCGGMAMALHGFPRFTRDLDFLIKSEDLTNAIQAAKKCGFEDEPEMIRLGQQSGRLCEICRINKFEGEDHLTLDLVLVNPALEDVWKGRVLFEWLGRSLPVVSTAGLARMKLLAGRPQDLVDIQSLGFQIDDPTIQP